MAADRALCHRRRLAARQPGCPAPGAHSPAVCAAGGQTAHPCNNVSSAQSDDQQCEATRAHGGAEKIWCSNKVRPCGVVPHQPLQQGGAVEGQDVASSRQVGPTGQVRTLRQAGRPQTKAGPSSGQVGPTGASSGQVGRRGQDSEGGAPLAVGAIQSCHGCSAGATPRRGGAGASTATAVSRAEAQVCPGGGAHTDAIPPCCQHAGSN